MEEEDKVYTLFCKIDLKQMKVGFNRTGRKVERIQYEGIVIGVHGRMLTKVLRIGTNPIDLR